MCRAQRATGKAASQARLTCGRACSRVPASARDKCDEAGVAYREGLHAAGHAMVNVLPLFMSCNPADMRAECDNPYATRFRPERLLMYDSHPGGLGLSAEVGPPPRLLPSARCMKPEHAFNSHVGMQCAIAPQLAVISCRVHSVWWRQTDRGLLLYTCLVLFAWSISNMAGFGRHA